MDAYNATARYKLAAVSAMAIVAQRGTDEGAAALTSAPAPAGWNIAFAGSRGATGDAQRTTCGQVLAPESLGVKEDRTKSGIGAPGPVLISVTSITEFAKTGLPIPADCMPPISIC